MYKYKITALIDKLFISAGIFIIIFAWVNFYIRDLWSTFVLSLIFSFACVFLLFFLINKKQTKQNLSKKKFEEINSNFYCFKLLSKKEKIKLMENILSKEYECSTLKNCLKYKKDEKTHTVLFCTHYAKINNEILLDILDEVDFNTECLDIICTDYDNNINLKIFNNKQINLINKIELYENYFEKYKIYPDKSNLNLKTQKIKFLDILQNFFLPHKSKQYFICGLILIFSSIILPYHAYYLIFGSMLMLFSIICKIIPKYKN